MTAGTNDKKKVVFLGLLVFVALYFLYTNMLSGPSAEETAGSATPARTGAVAAPSPAVAMPESAAPPPRAAINRSRSEEFHPVLHPKRAEDRIDPTKIDPTLRLDLLAKVQAVDLAGGSRNLFQVGPPPPPPPPKPAEVLKGKEPKIALKPAKAAEAPKTTTPVEPPPPPIPLKYYGFSTARDNGRKTAFFLDGDNILLAAEGQTLNRRYKVVRIGPTFVVMEDTQSKHQQNLPLAPELAG